MGFSVDAFDALDGDDVGAVEFVESFGSAADTVDDELVDEVNVSNLD